MAISADRNPNRLESIGPRDLLLVSFLAGANVVLAGAGFPIHTLFIENRLPAG
jgi:hypothetical protein|tara:strand:+ start:279 stop:437 length:159 start_codon:yes stop_codon:yes gene_type:complete